jgi:glyoxylate reductase
MGIDHDHDPRINESEKFTREGKFRGWEPLFFLGRMYTIRPWDFRDGTHWAGGGAARGRFWHEDHLPCQSTKELDFAAELVDFETMLKESDILSLHLPLTDETRHLIGERELHLMKKSAVLINTARGAIVDEPVLIRALQERWIYAAGFDVMKEPYIPGN